MWTHGERAGAYQVPAFLLSLMFYIDAVHSMVVQNVPPPNMSLLCEDYFELKAVETLGVHEKLPYYPEELKLGLFPRKESVPVINVTKVAPTCVSGQTSAQVLLFFLSSWEGPSHPWKAPASSSQLRMAHRPHFPSGSPTLSCMWDSCL